MLAVLPTGGGKSAIYELAGMLRAGPTVVVSPLIALQDDQLAHLQAAGLSAIVLNSQQSAGARAAALLASCDPGTLVFLSPEQLANNQTRQALQRARPGLFVVDEAHLISQWGHDFRPDYMLLGAQAEAVGAPVRLALTATAAPPDYPGPCGNCDNDLTQAEAPPAEVPFAVGARVVSERWGQGTVQRYDGDQVTVLFDEHGYRELFVPLVVRRGLLRPA